MESFETINSTHILELNISPNEGDIAIVSIDSNGTQGRLNSFVLKEYGYSLNDLPDKKKLIHGFSQIPAEKKKAILFVVTVDDGITSYNLETNLYNTLTEFRGWFRGKKLWLPLMGTGDGGLTLEESYSIIVKTVNKFQKNYPTETTILLSIPESPEGKKLIKQIQEPQARENENFDAENFVKAFDGKFYLVGSFWSGDNQLARFFEEGIWEKGYEDDSYSSLINQIKKNDVLIVKSTYASDNISYLRVKAFGIVIENLEDGSTLSVDWKIKDISINIENLGFYRNTIHEAAPNDIITILSKIDKNRWKALAPIPPSNLKKETIAGLVSDSDKGIDYLDITKDVNAFAKVIAAKSFEPPLAIALFGKWGSGKSFFMRKLKEQISTLSLSKTEGIYCEGIAHIHFNAWSYMDSNLWASIVTKIFEELNEYISENSKTAEAKKEIEKQLTNQLSIAKEEIGILRSKKKSVIAQIIKLNRKKKIIANELDQKIKKVKKDTVWQIITTADQEFKTKDKILEALNENNSYIKTEADLKNIIPEKYWNNPEKTYQLAKSRTTFLKEFFRRDKIQTNLICLAAILFIIAITPIVLELCSIQISKINFLLPSYIGTFLYVAGATWKRAETVYKQLQPVIASFWKIKEAHENIIKEAKSKFEQEEKALKLEIEKGESEVLLIQEQIQKAETIKTDLDFRINTAFATEALYSFIERRSKSEDYKKHLGLISIIRRDFEILNNLFTDHNQETSKIKNSKEFKDKFKDKFKKPLERIILYIDDLDRCPEENVVQVLEAVNLLMAFPLFVVVVGVDSRWVKNALIKKHALQFTGRLNDNEVFGTNLDLIEPSNYLEKIFQIPFHLKDAQDTSVKDMIKKLALSKAQIKTHIEEEFIEEEYVANPTTDIEKEKNLSNTNPNNNTDTIIIDKPEALILTDDEITLMQDMSEIIGNNPRAIKRFVNIYRIIKAHEAFDYEADSTNQELCVILFLLALPLGDYRKLLPSFELYFQNNEISFLPFRNYLQESNNIGTLNTLKHQLDVTLSDKVSFNILQNTSLGTIKKHNDFIRRFTFKQL
ncbi:MAG: P-loop NTPase fold protein [Bacteroidota bacterium]